MNHYTCQQRVWNRSPRCFWKMALVGFFLQCGGWKCVITHAVKEIRFVLTLLVKQMMKCREATWALISFYYYNATFLGSPLSHFQHLSRFRSANQISAVCTAHGKHVKSTVRQSYVVILDVLYSEENEIEMKVIQSTTWRQSWCHKSWWWSAIFGNFGLPGFCTCHRARVQARLQSSLVWEHFYGLL